MLNAVSATFATIDHLSFLSGVFAGAVITIAALLGLSFWMTRSPPEEDPF
jgi:hypothetical protein